MRGGTGAIWLSIWLRRRSGGRGRGRVAVAEPRDRVLLLLFGQGLPLLELLQAEAQVESAAAPLAVITNCRSWKRPSSGTPTPRRHREGP